jgi:hypothetical protein
MNTSGIRPCGVGRLALGMFRGLLTGHENPNVASEVEYSVTHETDEITRGFHFTVYGAKRGEVVETV